MQNLKKGKRVCILTSVHPAFDTRIFHKQAKTLVKAGYDVSLIARHGNNEVVDGVKIVALAKSKDRFRRMIGSLRLVKPALREKAQVYHFHDPELIPVAVLIKLVTRKKIIYDVHEDVPRQIMTKEWVPTYSRGLVSTVFALAERASFPFFDAVVAAGEDIVLHLPHSPRLVVIRNFPSLEIARQAEGGHGQKSKGEPVVLIYVGGLSEDRGARKMVEAVGYLQGKARLVLVGSFSDPRLEHELREKATEEVEFTGQVPYQKVFSFLSKGDIGLICFHPTPNNIASSWRNNKLFEYMAAGLPVIASNFSAFKEVIDGNNCGITVNPLDAREIAKAVEYLIEHPDEAKKMGENGRKAVMDKYNWETESTKLLAVYDDLLKGK